MKKILFLILILSTNVFAQSEADQFNKQIEEIMKARAEMLKSLMEDSSMSGAFEKRMEEIMKSFNDDSFGGFEQMEAPVIGEYDWITTDTQKILKVKVKQVKDHPLDIKIEKGMISFKGDVEVTQGSKKNLTKNKVRFERSFSIPKDVDQNNPEFENKAGELLVKFKKLTPAKKSVDRVPVVPDSNDLSI